MTELLTAKIVHEDGFCIINKSDFDPKVHTLYTDGNGSGTASTSDTDTGELSWVCQQSRQRSRD